jgi:hypothetical protein
MQDREPKKQNSAMHENPATLLLLSFTSTTSLFHLSFLSWPAPTKAAVTTLAVARGVGTLIRTNCGELLIYE